jgi:uncharacterized membrane protein
MIFLGISTGMRTLTATTVLCWYAWLGLLPQHGWTFWAGNLISVIVFTAMALGEYVADTLPMTPSRTTPPQLISRLVFGTFAGVLASRTLAEPLAGGVLFGLSGTLVGTYGGHRLRMVAAKRVGRDLPVALCESALALGLALLAAHEIRVDLLKESLFPR